MSEKLGLMIVCRARFEKMSGRITEKGKHGKERER
jgi:hypothetical protein